MILGPEILGPGWRRRPLRRDRRQREPGKTTTNNKTKQRWCQTQESVPLSLSQRPHSLAAPIASLFFRLRSCSSCVSSFFFLLALFFFFSSCFSPQSQQGRETFPGAPVASISLCSFRTCAFPALGSGES